MGTAEAITPFLPVPVKGHVYLARPGCGGRDRAACTEQDVLDGNLYKLYLELGGTGRIREHGDRVQGPAETQVNPATGQLTTSSRSELVQAPFSELKIHLNGGPRAPIDNPRGLRAGAYDGGFHALERAGSDAGRLARGRHARLIPSSFFDVGGCARSRAVQPGLRRGHCHAAGGVSSARSR